MTHNLSKIFKRASLIILAIIISSLLNICLFSWQTNAAPMPMPKINFASASGDTCAAQPLPEPLQNINSPAVPMPECCLAQNRNFDATINTANDKISGAFSGLIILSSNNLKFENNFVHNISQNIFPPPALSLATTVIRE
ncbi:MAG: hypothetical protein Q7R92_03185 [bacterium]|nr:hypothetical protein [bacterium]